MIFLNTQQTKVNMSSQSITFDTSSTSDNQKTQEAKANFVDYTDALTWTSRKYRSPYGVELRNLVDLIYGESEPTLSMKNFLSRVELARKTPLSWDEIEIIANRRSKVAREEKPVLNSFTRWMVFLARKYAQMPYYTSPALIREHLVYEFGNDDKTIGKEEFIQMVKLAQRTPLNAEEIQIIMDLRRKQS